MNKASLLLFLLLVVSCKKQAAHKVDEEFVGHWTHRISSTENKYITVEDDSRGWVDVYNTAGEKTEGGDQKRKWLVKKDYLYFGWLGMGDEKFHIDQYPAVAALDFIFGLDTIPAGKTYMVLDGKHYIKTN